MTQAELAESFERFWRAYPRRVSKKDARKAWAQLALTPELVDRIMAALDWQRRQPQWLRDGGQFVPYPASWIRAERWDDEEFVPEVKPMERNPFVPFKTQANRDALAEFNSRRRA
jgi:hypothetical protein